MWPLRDWLQSDPAGSFGAWIAPQSWSHLQTKGAGLFPSLAASRIRGNEHDLPGEVAVNRPRTSAKGGNVKPREHLVVHSQGSQGCGQSTGSIHYRELKWLAQCPYLASVRARIWTQAVWLQSLYLQPLCSGWHCLKWSHLLLFFTF